MWSCVKAERASPAEGAVSSCCQRFHFSPSLLLKGHGSSMERWTEKDGAHLSSPHGRSDNTMLNMS